MRVFLDANVLFSAALTGSVTDQLIDRLHGVGTVVTSALAIEEARRNLERKRAVWLPHFEQRLVGGGSGGTSGGGGGVEVVPSLVFPLPVTLAEKDRPLLCAAIRSGCGYFATGDARDFGHLYDQTVEGVRVVSLLSLAKLIRDAES